MKMRLFYVVFLLTCFTLSGCLEGKRISQSSERSGKIELVIVPYAGDKLLYLDSIYQSPQGEKYSLRSLRFFLSDIALAHSSGKEDKTYSSNNALGIYLLNYNKEGSDSDKDKQGCKIEFNVSEGEYSDFRFNIGIPREANHGDPSSAPSPLNGAQAAEMYWEWNSGYIFFLAEGKIHDSKSQPFHFALGDDSRIMPVSFGNLFEVTPLLKVQKGKTTRIKLSLDFNKLLINGDKSFYSLNTPEQAIVHGGYYADLLRNNLIQSIQFISSEIVESVK